MSAEAGDELGRMDAAAFDVAGVTLSARPRTPLLLT